MTFGRMSLWSPTASPLLKVDVRRPRLRGEDTTTAIPRSRQVARRLVPAGLSMSREKTEYSVWTAVTVAILTARRSVAEETDERPMYFILPSLGYSR